MHTAAEGDTAAEVDSAALHSEQLRVPIERGALAMVHKHRAEDRRQGAVVLIHGFAQNGYVWDLPGRSFADYLARLGFDVFNLDLRGHGASRKLGAPTAKRFEQYVDTDLPAALDVVASLGHERVFLVGHSLGGAVAYATAPLQRERVRGVVTLSGVFHWGGGTRTVAKLAQVLHRANRLNQRWGVGGIPTIPLDLVGSYLAKRLRRGQLSFKLPLQGWVPGTIENHVLESWLSRSLDRSSGSILALMGHWGATGTFCTSDGKRDYGASWAASGLPVLVIGADRDLLAHPFRDVKPAYDTATAIDRTFRCFGSKGESVGHVDLLIGKRAPTTVWPAISNWLAER